MSARAEVGRTLVLNELLVPALAVGTAVNLPVDVVQVAVDPIMRLINLRNVVLMVTLHGGELLIDLAAEVGDREEARSDRDDGENDVVGVDVHVSIIPLGWGLSSADTHIPRKCHLP